MMRPDLNQSHGHVLFVDDEEGLVVATIFLLTDLGYKVSAYTDAQAALDAFEAAADTFDWVISDQTMPELTGWELTKAVRSIRPDIPIILCSGYSHITGTAETAAQGSDALLAKRFSGS